MRNKRDWPGRAIDLETYFNRRHLEDPEDPPINYQGVRTDRYLYASTATGSRSVRPADGSLRAAEPAGNPAYARRKASLQRLLAAEGATAPDGPAACGRGQAEGAELLDRQGRGKGEPQEATFYLRGKKVGNDAKPPHPRSAAHTPSSGEQLEAVASSLDGRKVRLERTLHC